MVIEWDLKLLDNLMNLKKYESFITPKEDDFCVLTYVPKPIHHADLDPYCEEEWEDDIKDDYDYHDRFLKNNKVFIDKLIKFKEWLDENYDIKDDVYADNNIYNDRNVPKFEFSYEHKGMFKTEHRMGHVYFIPWNLKTGTHVMIIELNKRPWIARNIKEVKKILNYQIKQIIKK